MALTELGPFWVRALRTNLKAPQTSSDRDAICLLRKSSSLQLGAGATYSGSATALALEVRIGPAFEIAACQNDRFAREFSSSSVCADTLYSDHGRFESRC